MAVHTVDSRRDETARGKQREADEPILAKARARLKEAIESEAQLRIRMLADQKFSANLSGDEQWDPQALTLRVKEGRPHMTVDRLSQPIYSLANQARESGAHLRIEPVDEGADVETAEVVQGLTRNIENQSRANLAYVWAREAAIRMGRGFVRIVAEYARHASPQDVARHAFDASYFDQDLRIKRVLNPFNVYPDSANAQEPDYSDGRYYLVVQDYAVPQYLSEYGAQSSVVGLDDFASIGDHRSQWAPGGKIRLAEFYDIESTWETLYFFRDNLDQPVIVLAGALEDMRAQLASRQRFIAGDAENVRQLEVRQIKWYKLNGVEILERSDVPGKWIPIIPVLGEELFVDGERDYRGIVRGAVEAVKGYHFQVNGLIEAVNLIPKAAFVASAGQIKNFEQIWANANTETYAVLPYNEISVAGQLVPAPQRNSPAPPIQALVAAILHMDEGIKASTRYFDASLGKAGPQESGVAIGQRQRQGDIATSHFDANFRDITLAHIGRILIDQIPYYYDARRVARIIGADEQRRTVTLNAPFKDEQGIDRLYQIGVGQYDAHVEAGPGYATRQAETREDLRETLKAVPGSFPVIADLYFKALGHPDLAARFKKGLPAEFREPGPGEPAPLPPEVQQQMAALQEQLQQMAHELEQAHRDVAAGTAKAESSERIAQAKIAADERQAAQEATVKMAIAQMQVDQKNAQVALEAKLEEIKLLFQAQREDEGKIHAALREDRHRAEDRTTEGSAP